MRRVLVDDDDAVRGLRDDIGLVQLRARDAERQIASARARPAAASTRAESACGVAVNSGA